MEREVETHLRMRVDELVARGWEPGAAREEAERMFGDTERVKRDAERAARSGARAGRRRRFVDGWVQDLRYAARGLVRSPVFTGVALVTLGLGIGANSAIFSVVHGVLLSPLPYPEPDEIVALWEESQTGGTMSVAWPNARDWAEQATTLEAVAPHNARSTTVLGLERPVRTVVAPVGREFWGVFPVVPEEGRLTGEEDHREGAAPVAVVARDFWEREMGGVALEEASLEISGVRLRVVGVLPAAFDFPSGARIWTPAEISSPGESRSAHNWSAVGRLAPGVGAEAATQELAPLTRRLVAGESEPDSEFLAAGAVAVPLRDEVVGDARRPLLLLFGAAGLVLLVACTNLTSTLLARGTARERELAVRASLGAGRGRIARLLLTESALLAGLGAVVGLGVAGAVLAGLRHLGPASLPRLDEIGLDPGVVGYTAAVAAATALLVGLLPAVKLTGRPARALGGGSRGNAADHRSGVWRALVGIEVALALVLLAGSGLLVRSFQALLQEDAGFHGEDVATLTLGLSRAEYPEPADHARLYARLLDELEAVPGVAAAGLGSSLPVQGFVPNGRIELDGDLSKHATAVYLNVSGRYFEALDIALLQGRTFQASDGPDDPHVAMVSRSFAERYWPDQDPVGRQISGGGMDLHWEERPFATVVGVVGDVRYRSLGRAPEPTVYFPFRQRPGRIQWGANLVVETAGSDPGALIPDLRAVLTRVEPDVAPRVAAMSGRVRDSLAERRFLLLLLGAFAGVALVLAVVGIYGVVSYTVARRTREMGIRLALGAPPGRVRSQVVRGAMVMVAGGLVVGIVGAFLAGRAVESLLYGIRPTDPVALVAGVVVLAVAGLVASWVPAWSGTRVDPTVTMRAE